MPPRLSRRAFLAVIAGGAATAAGAGSVLWMSRRRRRVLRHAGGPLPYVDRNGWMLTVEDAKKLGSPAAEAP